MFNFKKNSILIFIFLFKNLSIFSSENIIDDQEKIVNSELNEKVNFYENLIYNQHILPKILKNENLDEKNIKNLFDTSLKYLINKKDLSFKETLNKNFQKNYKELIKNRNLIKESKLEDSLKNDLFKYLTFKNSEDYIISKSIPNKNIKYENFFQNLQDEKEILNLLVKDENLLNNFISILKEAKKNDKIYFDNTEKFFKSTLSKFKNIDSFELKIILSKFLFIFINGFLQKNPIELIKNKNGLKNGLFFLPFIDTFEKIHNYHNYKFIFLLIVNFTSTCCLNLDIIQGFIFLLKSISPIKNKIYSKVKNIKNTNLFINKNLKKLIEKNEIFNYIFNFSKNKFNVNLFKFTFTNFYKNFFIFFKTQNHNNKCTNYIDKKIDNQISFLDLRKNTLYLIDSLVAKALLIKNNNKYSIPEYIKSNNLIFEAEEIHSPEYKNAKKNNINLKEETNRNMLIIGPTGAGKTDFLRTAIKTSLFSNIGISPSKNLKITPFKVIEQNLSSANISKELSKGQIERKDITEFFENLNKTKEPVLICIDEIFSSVDNKTSLFLTEKIFKNNLNKKNLISILNTHNPKHRILLNESNSIKEYFPFLEIKKDDKDNSYNFKKKYKILENKDQLENFWIADKNDPLFQEKNKIKDAFIEFILEEEEKNNKN